MKGFPVNYDDFLKSKIKNSVNSGIDTENINLNPKLFDFQEFIVNIALQKGRFALFTDTGTGKTFMQLEWAKHISEHTKKPVLILAPLAVSGQTIQEGEKFGIEVFKLKSDVFGSEIFISNYEQIDNIDCSQFSGIVLDESSILKNFTGKIKNKIIDSFAATKYKLACTATPSPNDHMELGNHAEFLNIMPSNEMLSRWFINDTMHFGSYRLKGHAENDFWEWIASWAMMMMKPQDIGFEQEGYELPPLNIIEKRVDVDITDFQNGNLFKQSHVNATNFNKELRNTINERMQCVSEIANGTNENVLIWVNQNVEADKLKQLIPDAVEVRGNEKSEIKERKLLDFAGGKFRVLITKKKIAQFGMNFQNCHNQIFAGLDFSFEGLYQAIRRSYRFGQRHPVNAYIITTETMQNVIKAINDKQNRFTEMQERMTNAISSIYKSRKKEKLKLNYKHIVEKTDQYEMHLGDSVELIDQIEDNSIDFSIFSPPFSNLYIYSDSIRDMGNSANDEEFLESFNFLIEKLYKKMRPGRLVAVHVKNLVNYMNSHGKSGLRDFRGDIIRSFVKYNFSYHSEVTIWKDPVIEMQKTKAHGLLYKQLRADSSFSRQGMAEYLLLFRRWPETDKEQELVVNVDWKTYDNFPLERWQEWASPVWNSIRQTNVLNIRIARESKDEKHICPLQLDVIERAVAMWTNENELVFSPFAGIGSEGFQAIKMNRRFVGIELKEAYFNQAVKNLNGAIMQNAQMDWTNAV